MITVPRELPILSTVRLKLRAFTLCDARLVRRYAGDYDVAKMTLNIPYPYEDGLAEEWIGTHEAERAGGAALTWAVSDRKREDLIGAIGLMLDCDNQAAEIGYWIGKPFWGRGYATEATQAVIECGFDNVGLHRIYARHFTSNPASGRVIQKAGMQYEGTLRHMYHRFGEWRDFAFYSILKDEYYDRTGQAN